MGGNPVCERTCYRKQVLRILSGQSGVCKLEVLDGVDRDGGDVVSEEEDEGYEQDGHDADRFNNTFRDNDEEEMNDESQKKKSKKTKGIKKAKVI
mgnify:CR=1 FL=1